MSDIDIEQKLADWQSRLTIISRNLMDLAQSANTQQISARLRDPVRPYQGLTAKRAKQAIEGRDDLWQDYLMLARVVEEASSLFNQNSIFRNTEDDVLALLESASVKMPTVHVPLPARDLLSAADRSDSATPAEILEAMQAAFATTRDELTAIGNAEQNLAPRIAAIKHEQETLERWAATLGSTGPRIETSLVSQIDADPLAYAMEADRIEAALNAERQRIEALEREHEAMRAELTQGRELLTTLKDLAQRCRAASDETKQKIAAPHNLHQPVADEVIESLTAWLTTLDETVAAGRWQAAKVGLHKWRDTINARIDSERAAYATNRMALDERADLRGRFSALQFKAQAFVARGIVLGETLERLTEETEQSLNQRPFNLEHGRQMLAAYEIALAAKTNRAH
jgi:hypothetical protein